MGSVAAKTLLLADADVLIDFAKARPAVLRQISRHVGKLHVLSQVLSTVDDLTRGDCAAHEIQIVSVSTDLLLEAGAMKQGALSFEDRLGLVAARSNGWTLVTNDRPLIAACRTASVPVRRGLRLVLELVQHGVLSKPQAQHVARAIHRVNPRHINARVLEQFDAELDAL